MYYFSSIDFSTDFTIDNHDLEVVDEIRLLGLISRSDLKWTSTWSRRQLRDS